MVVETLNNIIRNIRKRFAEMYRPEKHYMRGRGPAWLDKNQEIQSGSGARDPAQEAIDPLNAVIAKKTD